MSFTIAPAQGNAPFLTAGGVGDPSTGSGYAAIDIRRAWSRTYVEGVLDEGAFLAHESATPDLTITVDSDVGAAVVQGDLVADQGLYYVAPHASPGTLSWDGTDAPAPDTTNPRIDRIVLRVYDDEADGSGLNLAAVEVLDGVPSAGATLDDPLGVVALPDTAMHIADVLVGPGATAFTNADVRDYRLYGVPDKRVGDLDFSAASDPGPARVRANGASYKRAQHPRLWDALQDNPDCQGDGTLTFTVPDYEGRTPVGTDPNAKRGVTRNAGDAGGAITHTLTSGEVPPHYHSGTTPDHLHSAGSLYTGNHSHTVSASGSANTGNGNRGQAMQLGGSAEAGTFLNHQHFVSIGVSGGTSVAGNLGVYGATGASDRGLGFNTSGMVVYGGSAPHNNMQPFRACNVFIFTGDVAA